MRKICPKDQLHNTGVNAGDTFCWSCGSRLEEKDLNCQCGYEYGISDKFCPDCGRPLK